MEASKFTEVGYVGRDAESMVRDLVDSAINMVRTEREDEVYPQAEQRADERLLDLLLPGRRRRRSCDKRRERTEKAERSEDSVFVVSLERAGQAGARRSPPRRSGGSARARSCGQMLADGQLDEREVEIEVAQQGYPMMELIQPPQGIEGTGHQLHRDAAGHAAEAEEAAHGEGAGGAPDPGGRGARRSWSTWTTW